MAQGNAAADLQIEIRLQFLFQRVLFQHQERHIRNSQESQEQAQDRCILQRPKILARGLQKGIS